MRQERGVFLVYNKLKCKRQSEERACTNASARVCYIVSFLLYMAPYFGQCIFISSFFSYILLQLDSDFSLLWAGLFLLACKKRSFCVRESVKDLFFDKIKIKNKPEKYIFKLKIKFWSWEKQKIKQAQFSAWLQQQVVEMK